MGSRLDGLVMTDVALPFGWCESVRNFTIIDDFVYFVIQQRLPPHLKHFADTPWLIFYIDDFHIGAASKHDCELLLRHTLDTFDYLGLEVSLHFLSLRSIFSDLSGQMEEATTTYPTDHNFRLRILHINSNNLSST